MKCSKTGRPFYDSESTDGGNSGEIQYKIKNPGYILSAAAEREMTTLIEKVDKSLLKCANPTDTNRGEQGEHRGAHATAAGRLQTALLDDVSRDYPSELKTLMGSAGDCTGQNYNDY